MEALKGTSLKAIQGSAGGRDTRGTRECRKILQSRKIKESIGGFEGR